MEIYFCSCYSSKLKIKKMGHLTSDDKKPYIVKWWQLTESKNIFVTKFVGRKEADRVGSWRLRYVYLRQINSHRCALCVTPGNINSLVRLRDHSLYSFRLFLSDSSCARVFTPSLSLNCHSTAAFIRSPRQLLQSDTGDPHFALDPLTYRCLLSLLPLQTSLNHAPPRHIPPPPDSGREALRPAAPPPPPFLERKSATVICVPGLWITLNLKGCNARYQRVIRALVSFMRWSHCKGAWSEQRVNSRPRR